MISLFTDEHGFLATDQLVFSPDEVQQLQPQQLAGAIHPAVRDGGRVQPGAGAGPARLL